jgi:hypothetical protein
MYWQRIFAYRLVGCDLGGENVLGLDVPVKKTMLVHEGQACGGSSGDDSGSGVIMLLMRTVAWSW